MCLDSDWTTALYKSFTYLLIYLLTVVCVSFTYMKGFISMMNEMNDIAGQHEMIAENIATQILTDLSQLMLSLRQDRKRVSAGARLGSTRDVQNRILILSRFDFGSVFEQEVKVI